MLAARLHQVWNPERVPDLPLTRYNTVFADNVLYSFW